jgi:hypothetical protein
MTCLKGFVGCALVLAVLVFFVSEVMGAMTSWSCGTPMGLPKE